MREVNVSLRIYDPFGAAPGCSAIGGEWTPPNSWKEIVEDVGKCSSTAGAQPLVAQSLFPRPLRDAARAGLIRAVVLRAGKDVAPVTEDQVSALVDELLDGRPFLAWLAEQLRNGGLEKLIALLLDLLVLAA